ncbi:hypothetical protein FPOA_05951 [Fusarium poae]|uniref:Uncharacterized protein n=1 Tax=Fusarium poae TaxID=36050 RepID=A0A1B8AY64_FUSPO|nr:hypothetical protein FPOA_05951 [Fusarium poae]
MLPLFSTPSSEPWFIRFPGINSARTFRLMSPFRSRDSSMSGLLICFGLLPWLFVNIASGGLCTLRTNSICPQKPEKDRPEWTPKSVMAWHQCWLCESEA